ncbi:hypothetical protein QJS04_geneDACA017199 [Acorus gramineus]|uniref:Uncharacterized protein n=1 Tax=Acorus gramineus TaxID=55184 RepID=A0AAV9BMS0_ACOGR|nr:hypothetical protein QJS04_geneDACA017199 [Acorus gramineus]
MESSTTTNAAPNGEAPKGTTEGLSPFEIDGPTLYGLLCTTLSTVFSADSSSSLFYKVKTACADGGPRVAEACRNTARDVLIWTRKGGTFRALLVVSVGTITLLALTGFLVFILFFLGATISAIVISLLVSLVAVGGFLSLFFSCLIAIYIGALLVATFVISIMTITTIAAVIVATGWVGFLWTLWLAARKSVDLTKHSLNMTSSAISAYSTTRQTHRRDPSKSA